MSHPLIRWESVGILPPCFSEASPLSRLEQSYADRKRVEASLESLLASGKLSTAPDGYVYEAGLHGINTIRASRTQSTTLQRDPEIQQMRLELNELRERLVRLESQPTLASIGIPDDPVHWGGLPASFLHGLRGATPE